MEGVQEFDYVIVGAGSAGCVLAAQLSENGQYSVLLIEAGNSDNGLFVSMPMGLFKTLGDADRVWNYLVEPDPSVGKQHTWVRGKMLGGSSSLNGMLYFRGQPEDYDGWEAAGCKGWGWRDMRRAFRSIEDHELGDDGVRGVGGPLGISIVGGHTPLTDAILKAGGQMGLPVREDLNREDQEGIGYSPCTIRNGRRVSAATAFLKPARGRPNLTVKTGTLVEKVNFRDGRAIGVSCLRGDLKISFKARREVILCAGALQSPVILQLSGIGPADLLSALSVPLIYASSAVGENAREHKTIMLMTKVSGHSLNREFRGLRTYVNGLRYLLMHDGPMTSTYDINAFIRTSPELDRPDAQLTFWALSPDPTAATYQPDSVPGLAFMGYPLRSDSQGQVRAMSRDPREPPRIIANFLSTDHDRSAIVRLFRYARQLLAQPALAHFVVAETYPGPAVQTDEEIIASCHQDGTCLHTVGTCRMGADAGSVVDSRLRVRGVDGLRVVDCSVMPTQVSGNTNGPVMAMAWLAAEMILADATMTTQERKAAI
jgi:choline dehydrogenase